MIVPSPSGLLVAAVLAAAAPVQAGKPETAPQHATLLAELPFSAQKVKAYVEIKRRVKQISDKWVSRVMNAEGEAERRRIQARIQAEMRKTIRNGGLTVGEYHAITRAAQKDPHLRKRIDEFSKE